MASFRKASLITLADEAATEALGEKLAAGVRAGDFIALDGELGAGKTSFVRGFARGLGIDPRIVASPTFITMQTYSGGRMPLVHIDVWRLKHPEELETIGWDELLSANDGVIVVEWAQRIKEYLPAKRISVCIDFVASSAGSSADSSADSSPNSRAATVVDHRGLLA